MDISRKSVDDILYCIVEKEKKIYKILDYVPIGEKSIYGTIYATCKRKDCTYIAKIIKRLKSLEDIESEVHFQNEFSELGLAPKIEEWGYCKEKEAGIIIMKRLDITAKNLFVLLPSIDRATLLGALLSLLNIIHSRGLYHGDAHLDNFMLLSTFDLNDLLNVVRVDSIRSVTKKNIQNREQFMKNYNTFSFVDYIIDKNLIKFIDFGRSGVITGVDNIIQDYTDFLRSLQLLKKSYKEIYIKLSRLYPTLFKYRDIEDEYKTSSNILDTSYNLITGIVNTVNAHDKLVELPTLEKEESLHELRESVRDLPSIEVPLFE